MQIRKQRGGKVNGDFCEGVIVFHEQLGIGKVLSIENKRLQDKTIIKVVKVYFLFYAPAIYVEFNSVKSLPDIITYELTQRLGSWAGSRISGLDEEGVKEKIKEFKPCNIFIRTNLEKGEKK